MAEILAAVAVIDDEPAVRKALKRLLRSAGFGVHTYSGGADFLQTVHTHLPDCLVVDIQMRPMDGFELLRQLKSLGVGTPAILITAYETPEGDELISRSGAIGFLRKPFSDHALIEMVHVALRMTRSASQTTIRSS
jgi:FixJ family two-component response regulator